MHNFPIVDETGLYNLKELIKFFKHRNIQIILSGVQQNILKELQRRGIDEIIGLDNIVSQFDQAIALSKQILNVD